MRSWGEFSPKSYPAQFRAGSGASPDLTWAVASLVISIDVACCGSRSPRAVPVLPQETLRSPEHLAPTLFIEAVRGGFETRDWTLEQGRCMTCP
jgi:hypothetical protein